MRIPGVGRSPRRRSSSLPDARVFAKAHDAAAWLGLTPRQNSSRSAEKLGRVTKQGDRYLRKLMMLDATSLLRVAHQRKGGKPLVRAAALPGLLASGCVAERSRDDCMGRVVLPEPDGGDVGHETIWVER